MFPYTPGVITKVGAVDREKNDTIILKVVASDNGSPVRTKEVNVMIDVVDFNDNPPVFNVTNAVKSILEKCYNDTEIVTIDATDADKFENAAITFSITQTSTNFSIGSTTVRQFTSNHETHRK